MHFLFRGSLFFVYRRLSVHVLPSGILFHFFCSNFCFFLYQLLSRPIFSFGFN